MSDINVGSMVKFQDRKGTVKEIKYCHHYYDCGKSTAVIQFDPDSTITEEVHLDRLEIVQRNWFCISDAGHSGFFVWDVLEGIGTTELKQGIVNCRDDSFIVVSCYHFFTRVQMDAFMAPYAYNPIEITTLIVD